MLHVWTVNSVNRLFKNARTHYNNEPVVNLASSPGSFPHFQSLGTRLGSSKVSQKMTSQVEYLMKILMH